MTRRPRVPCAALLLALIACGDRPQFDPGDECTLNSDCFEPYVCRLSRCRIECAFPRDCPIGSACLLDAEGLGSCRLEDEGAGECALDSDCPGILVCRQGGCTNECSIDADCLAGSVCATDLDTGELGCFDPAEMECSQTSECGMGFVCTSDRRCREECRVDRDCRDGRPCVELGGVRMCDGP